MQLVKRPTCRCLAVGEPLQVLVDRANAVTQSHLDIFGPLVCTKCRSSHYPALGKAILPIPTRAQDVLEQLLNLDDVENSRPIYTVTDWREGLSHGDGGAPSTTIHLSCVKHARCKINFSWCEDAHAPLSKAKPISADALSAETLPSMIADCTKRLRTYDLEPTQRGKDANGNWLYLDSSHLVKRRDIYTFQVAMSWPIVL